MSDETLSIIASNLTVAYFQSIPTILEINNANHTNPQTNNESINNFINKYIIKYLDNGDIKDKSRVTFQITIDAYKEFKMILAEMYPQNGATLS